MKKRERLKVKVPARFRIFSATQHEVTSNIANPRVHGSNFYANLSDPVPRQMVHHENVVGISRSSINEIVI